MNSPSELWARVLKLMEADLTPTTINTWFDDAEAVCLEEDRFVLYTPSNFKRDTIASRYVPTIQKALRELFSADFQVTVLGEGELEKHTSRESSFLPGTEAYTFDSFVVGSSNKFAYAAAKAVADAPGKPKGYNPLFIYGESGLGKTHLLYAIAHAIHDVFLMDDVQFIAGREASQEEMFHTFNTLYEEGKQIVFTADRPPKEMLRLDDRLRTRFEWGLPIDVQPPD